MVTVDNYFWGNILWNVYYFSKLFNYYAKNKNQVYIYFFSSIVANISSVVCIRRFGINGAAYSYFITMFLHAAIYYVYFNYEINCLEKKEKARR